MTDIRPDLAQVVAAAADRAALGANAPALLLESLTHLGRLSLIATAATERGRRPFRPTPEWTDALGLLAFGVFSLADQTGVDLDAAVRATAQRIVSDALAAEQREGGGWPLSAE